MSDDLISRKEALEIIFEHGELNSDVWEPYADIKNLPTAYDVDTVCDAIHEVFKCEIERAFKETDRDKKKEKVCDVLNLNSEICKIVRNGGKK